MRRRETKTRHRSHQVSGCFWVDDVLCMSQNYYAWRVEFVGWRPQPVLSLLTCASFTPDHAPPVLQPNRQTQ